MRIPLATTIESRDGTLTRDAKVKNGIVETRGEDVPPIVRKRPGLTDLGFVRAGAAQLLYYWFGKVRTVIGDYLSGGALIDPVWSGTSFSSLGTASGAAFTSSNYRSSILRDSNGKIYIYGESGGVSYVNRMWESTDGGLTFTQRTVTGLPATANHYAEVVLMGGTFYAISKGFNGAGGPYYRGVYSSSDGYTFTTVTTTPAWTARSRPAICATTDKLWVIGGYSGSYLNDAWYSTDGLNWTQATAAGAFSARWYASAISPDGTSIWLMSGYDGTGKSDVWTSSDGATWTQATSNVGFAIDYSLDGCHPFAYERACYLIDYASGTINLYRAAIATPGTWTLGVAMSVSDTTNVYSRGFISDTGITVIDKDAAVIFSRELATGSTFSSSNLSPTNAGLQFSAQDNGANSPESLLMIKNSTQAWVVDTSDVVTQITDVDYPGKYTVTLTSLTRSSTTATATTAADTNFRAGDSVVIAGVNEAGWNGTYTILSTTRSGQTVPAPHPVAITITRSGTTATATSTAGPHGYTNGQSVTIAGAEQTQYNGTKTITWISATQFSFTVTVTSAVTAAPTSPATGTPVITPKTYFGLALSDFGIGIVDIQPQGTDQATISFFAALTAGVQVTIASCAGDPGFVGTHTIASTGTTYSRIMYSARWQGFTTITVRGPAPTISSITTDGAGVATVTTSAAHGFTTGQLVTITGASPWQYNVTDATVTVTGTTTFTYRHPYTSAADASPATPATGTITAQGPASVSGASFTFAVDGTETTPATGTITANSGRTTVPGIAYLNGYFVVMDEQGVLYNSALDDPENWNALEYTSALNEPGAGKAIAKSGNYIAAFKEWSTEFFYDAKNRVGSPLSPVENGFTLVGCASGESVANVDGALMWVAQSKKHKGRSVYAMRGIEQAKVSTPAVERILNADSLATVRAWGARIDGHPCYILTLVGSGVTLVLDASTGIWHEWSTLTIGSSVSVSSITRDGTTATVTCATAHGISDGDPVTIAGATQTDYNGTFQAAYVSATAFAIEVENSPTTPATGTILAYPYSSSYFKLTHYASANGVDVTLHATDGHLYEIDPDTYQDDGVPVDFFVRTSRLDGGSIRRKKIARISVVGEGADDSAMLRFSDDDSATFVSYRRVTLSDAEPNIRRCGAFERRSLEFRHVGNTAPRPEALELLIGE